MSEIAWILFSFARHLQSSLGPICVACRNASVPLYSALKLVANLGLYFMGERALLTPPASAPLTCLAWSTQPLSGEHHMSLPLSPGPILRAHSARLLVQSKADLSQPRHLVCSEDISGQP